TKERPPAPSLSCSAVSTGNPRKSVSVKGRRGAQGRFRSLAVSRQRVRDRSGSLKVYPYYYYFCSCQFNVLTGTLFSIRSPTGSQVIWNDAAGSQRRTYTDNLTPQVALVPVRK